MKAAFHHKSSKKQRNLRMSPVPLFPYQFNTAAFLLICTFRYGLSKTNV